MLEKRFNKIKWINKETKTSICQNRRVKTNWLYNVCI